MNYLSLIMDFFFPQNITCLICQRPIHPNNSYSLCRGCFNEMIFIKEECHKCGKPVVNRINIEENNEDKQTMDDEENQITKDDLKKSDYSRCKFCKNKTFYFDRAVSCVEYCDKSKVLVLSLKYYGHTYMARYIAQIMKDKLEFEQLSADYIIPVPLHKKRMRLRGFNQAEKIARYLSEYTEIPIRDCVQRNRNTKRLYALDKHQREKELKNAFEVKNGSEEIKGKKVLLIDDIFTTGTTVNEISKKLRIYGVEEIIVLTFLTRNIN